MPVIKKINEFGDVISSDVKDYSNDPFVLKKAAIALAFVEKYGLPGMDMKRTKTKVKKSKK